ncbi:MAG: DUF805 domain-containing protein [Peptostreptococcaceae bacterium]|nr:DUF805 domain-containing protein [Peptostreptococcaceae bacterium]
MNIEELQHLSNNKTFKDNYNEIFSDLNNSFIVCHNSKHDLDFIKSEFTRVDNNKQFIYQEFCTMEHYTDILKIPSDSFKYKYPKLIEIMPYLNIKRGDIYSKSKELFDIDDSDLDFHDSRVDVVSTYLIAINTTEVLKKYKEISNKRIMPNGDIYEGNIVNRVGIGHGRLTFSGNIYEGDFFDWIPNGKGEFFFKDGSHYIGRVVKGRLKGTGKYTFAEGTIYEGEFLDDKFNGYGKIIWDDGTIYEGNFRNDKKHGYGKLIKYGEIVKEGLWDNDVLQEEQNEEAYTNINESLGECSIECAVASQEAEIKDKNELNCKSDNNYIKSEDEIVSKKRGFLKSIFSFKGTIDEGQYILYKLLLGLLSVCCAYACLFIYENTEMTEEVVNLLSAMTITLLYFINITLIVRRLHDINKSAWWLISMIVPILNIIVAFELIFKKSVIPNKYILSLEKDTIETKKYKNFKINKWVIILSLIIIFIASVYIKNKKENEMIDAVKNFEEQDGYTVQDMIDNSMENKFVYGWYVDKVNKDTYCISYEFEDKNYEGKINALYYEYYRPIGLVTPIEGDLMQEYIDLGFIPEDYNLTKVINTTYHKSRDNELLGDEYKVDKQLSEYNIDSYNASKDREYDNRLTLQVYSGGSRATVYVENDSSYYHQHSECEMISNKVFRVFLDDAIKENRILCELEEIQY